MHQGTAEPSLICRIRERWCALPLRHVVEIMRPLPVESVAGAPPFVRGVAIIRGQALPVLDAARMLGGTETPAARFVVVEAATHRVALAVQEVSGVRTLAVGALQALPPLLREVDADVVAAIGRLDARLLLVLGDLRRHAEVAAETVAGSAAGTVAGSTAATAAGSAAERAAETAHETAAKAAAMEAR